MLTPKRSAMVFKNFIEEPSLKDRENIDEYVRIRDETKGIHVGDFIRLSDGSLVRVSYIWLDGCQISYGGSFHLGVSISFSGGLEPSIPFEDIKPTNEVKLGYFWTNHNNLGGADKEIGIYVPCKVYEVV